MEAERKKSKPTKVKVKMQLEKVKDTKPTRYQLLCYKLVGKYTKKLIKPKLEKELIQAHMKILPEEYMAYTVMTSILVAVSGAVLSSIIISCILLLHVAIPFIFILLPCVLTPAGIGAIAYVVLQGSPKSRSKSRAKDMNRKLPYAMNFISAMASADVNLDIIFRELAKEKIYGEIAREAAWITRDVDMLGRDMITALRDAIERSPSMMFQDFLQGVITTATSGGRLKPYFVLKADQYMKQHRMEQKKFQNTLGILAESFVTVVVAAPLFLIVMMSMMALVSESGQSTVMFLYIIVYVMIPASQFLFIFVIKSMNPEVG